MSFRPGSRIFSSFRPFFQRANARRRVNTAAGAEPTGFAKFWNSPIGPKTVHFWYAIIDFLMQLDVWARKFAHLPAMSGSLVVCGRIRTELSKRGQLRTQTWAN